MRREVIYAKLHGTDAFLPGIGGLGSTLPPANKAINMKMYREANGDLELEFNGKLAAIPAANLQLVMYKTEEVSTPTAAQLKVVFNN